MAQTNREQWQNNGLFDAVNAFIPAERKRGRKEHVGDPNLMKALLDLTMEQLQGRYNVTGSDIEPIITLMDRLPGFNTGHSEGFTNNDMFHSLWRSGLYEEIPTLVADKLISGSGDLGNVKKIPKRDDRVDCLKSIYEVMNLRLALGDLRSGYNPIKPDGQAVEEEKAKIRKHWGLTEANADQKDIPSLSPTAELPPWSDPNWTPSAEPPIRR